VYKSSDAGATWMPTTLNNRMVYSLASSSNVLFAGTMDFFSPKGIYKSTNNGTSWTQTSLNNRSVFAILATGSALFAGTGSMTVPYGVYKSTNNGVTWTQTTLNNKHIYSMAANNTTIFAGTFNMSGAASGIWRSEDQGLTWSQTSLNDRQVYAITAIEGKLFAGTDAGTFLSGDNGNTWTPLNDGMPRSPIIYSFYRNSGDILAGTANLAAWKRDLTEILVPVSISVSDTVFNGHDTCFNATSTITVAGGGTTFVVQNGGSATMIAGEKILYLPGTMVDAGGYMLGYITLTNQYCGASTAPMVAVKTSREESPETEANSGFRIYPNPTTGSFTLELPETGISDNVSAFICDIRGNKVLGISLSGMRKQVISLENQPKGMYFIRLFSNEKSETAKILKQ
jgi:photosystem II stability/assembly factor-like uncharacterized protein